MKLSEFFNIQEMARPRDRAAWAVLDWAAQQPDGFTIEDAWSIWTRNGGGGTITNLHTMLGKRSAKQHKAGQLDSRGKPYWPPSQDRPLVLGKKGRVNTYKWADDVPPLREPPEDDPEFDQFRDDMSSGEESDPVGDAIDRLERGMDRMPLKAAIQRWRNMNDPDRIIDDIKKEIPARLRMDAVRVAMANLLARGKVSKQDAQDAEDEVKGGLPTKSKQKTAADIDIDDEDLFSGDWEEAEDTEETDQPEFDPLDILKEPPKPEPKPEPPAPPSRPPPPPVDKSKMTQEPIRKGPPPIPQRPNPFGLSKVKKEPK